LKFEDKNKILDQTIIEQRSPNTTELASIKRLPSSARSFAILHKAVWAGLLPSQVAESPSPPSLPDEKMRIFALMASGFRWNALKFVDFVSLPL
jgi:hypothetical protein